MGVGSIVTSFKIQGSGAIICETKPLTICECNANSSIHLFHTSIINEVGAVSIIGTHCLIFVCVWIDNFLNVVADVLGSAFSPALMALFARHDEAAMDYLSFRRDMEGLAAERAARLGSDTDLAVISAIFAKMETAHDNPEEEATLDAQFHMSIVEASHNVVMLHMMRSMYDLLRGGVFYNRQMMFKQQTKRAVLLDQHREIHDALLARDSVAARTAVDAHLTYVERALLDQQRAERHEDVALQRLDHARGH